ncbi:unnamed protein product [Schistosoma turkestanicum]|nr:unnamed protein product [Schistosoma turkestanicum]
MEWDSENALQGVFITVIVCLVSSVLYFMFRNTLFAHRNSVHKDSENFARKKKKNDVKKSKKVKKRKVLVDSQQIGEIETDKTQTSDDTTGEEDEHLLDMPLDDQSSNSSGRSVERPIQPVKYEVESYAKGDSEPINTSADKSERSYVESSNLDFLQTTLNRSQSDDSDSIVSPSSSEHNATTSILSPVNESKASLVKSKKSKRRAGKRPVRCGDSYKEAAIFVEPNNMEFSSKSPETSKTDCTKPYKADEKQESLSDSTSTMKLLIKELEGRLKISETKLTETSQWANSLAEENKHFRTKKDETSLSLNVLQMQYNELLRTNKTLEQQKNSLNVKLKNTETENCDLHKRLDQINADALKIKKEAELELCSLREKLNKQETQLTAMAKAMTASAPSIPTGPIPEIVRAQELAQVVSNDNCILKSRIEQLDSELTQLRQTNMRQQQDLQVFRAENHKLRSEKETALEELRVKRQAEQVENDAAHMELKRRCHELELEKQKNQELSISLSEVRAELSRSLQQEKRQSEIISSLEYQFAELNAQKQCILDNANQSKLAYEAASSELRAQVANLSNDLIHVTNELNNAEQKVHELTYQLESVTKSFHNGNNMNDDNDDDDDDLNTEPIIISIKSNEICIDKQDEQQQQQHHTNHNEDNNNNNNHDKIYEDLRNRLSEVETNLNISEKERTTFYDLYQSALNEIDYYKSTLIQTEEVLAKLEESVKQTEGKWRQLLSESESEQIQLRKQLSESQSMLKDITEKLNRTDEEVSVLKTNNAEKKQKKSKTRKPADTSNLFSVVEENKGNASENIQPIN